MENKKTKVLYVITKGSPFGGAQKYVCDVATSLPTDQFEPVVVSGAGDDLRKQIEKKDTKKKIRTIQIPEMGRDISFQNDVTSFWKLNKIIRNEKPDVIHINSPKAAGIGAFSARMNRVPKIIYTVHGWSFNEKRNILSRANIRFFSWITMLLCNTIIVIAKSEEKQARAMPFVKNKIRLIYNGIAPIDFVEKDSAREFFIQKIGSISPSTIWIGTIAELHKNKNLATMIDVLVEIKQNIIWIIIGEGEERKHLEQKIRENNLAQKVFLIGKVENASTYLKTFDIFMLPSIKEGLPYTLLEAGLAGLPCLSTTVGGIPEIIENNVSGILTKPTAKNIRTGLEFIVSHPDEAERYGKNLKEKTSENFSLKEMVRKIQAVYRGK